MKEKSLGQYFTPFSIVKFMINLISDGSKSREILEPSAGKGIFLETLRDAGYDNLTGIEIDNTLLNQSSVPIRNENFFEFPESFKFDICIGNPPYVRWKNLTDLQRNYLSSSSFWKKRMNGLTDILQPFIFKSIDHLNPGGELIFISPSFWMQTLHAEPLRRFLIENGSFELIVNFHETRIFPKANLNLIIFKYRKLEKLDEIKIINYWHKGKIQEQTLNNIFKIINNPKSWSIYSTRDGRLEYYKTAQPSNTYSWRFLSFEVEEKLSNIEKSCKNSTSQFTGTHQIEFSSHFLAEDIRSFNLSQKSFQKVKIGNQTYFKISRVKPLSKFLLKTQLISNTPEARYARIGDILEIGNGMVSGYDRAFKLESRNYLSPKELKLLIPVVKARTIHRYFSDSYHEYFLVKPGEISSEKSLKTDYPSLFEKLQPHRETLKKRYQYNRNIPYWEWVFIRNYELMRNADFKICVPCKDRFDKRGFLRFAICEKGVFATQDVTVLVKFNWVRESIEYITAFLNSNEIFQWVTNKGLIRGGVVEFSEKPLKTIPFRFIDWNSTKEKGIHDKVTKIVQEILQRKKDDFEKINQLNNLISLLFE